MAARRFDPARLDVAGLAADGVTLAGQWSAAELPRWQAMQSPPSGSEPVPVLWSARGEQRRASGESPQTWLHLQVSTTAWPTCQRCLRPFSQALAVQRALRFVDTESQAEALDADSEDDVLALAPAPDLHTLIEDELLLAWPIVPRHEQCAPPAHRAGEGDASPASPFAALQSLKPPPGR
ncbi:MAG TPA: DUF177 domain-containing protein [Burkholderiaceae bacterium]|nr:DUF177 domain-containing protein [Burkholderiaceae bacterium]